MKDYTLIIDRSKWARATIDPKTGSLRDTSNEIGLCQKNGKRTPLGFALLQAGVPQKDLDRPCISSFCYDCRLDSMLLQDDGEIIYQIENDKRKIINKKVSNDEVDIILKNSYNIKMFGDCLKTLVHNGNFLLFGSYSCCQTIIDVIKHCYCKYEWVLNKCRVNSVVHYESIINYINDRQIVFNKNDKQLNCEDNGEYYRNISNEKQEELLAEKMIEYFGDPLKFDKVQFIN